MDLQLSSLRADRTRRLTIPGLRIGDHHEDVVLLVQWTGASKAYQDEITNDAFTKLKPDERKALLVRAMAHLIVGWDCVPLATKTTSVDVEGQPLKYTPERGTQILSAFEADERNDLISNFLEVTRNGANFQRSLIDADDLGKG